MTSKDTLKQILRLYLKDEKSSFSDINDKELFWLANALNVSAIAAYVLNDNGYKSDIASKCIYKAISNYERLKEARSNIEELFNENSIKYLNIKGSSIAKYYKEPYLRYSSDIDIVVEKRDYDKALDLMTNTLGYANKQSALHEITLVNKEGINVDFHSNFLLDQDKYEEVFNNQFNENHEFNDNYKYLFHLVHGAMHLIRGQMELRYFIDLFYLRKNVDRLAIKEEINKLDLSSFDNAVNSYLDSLLDFKDYSEKDKEIDDFIFNYAKDEGASNRVLNNSDNKISYFFSHAFPPFSIMKGKYPILKKCPILLPIMYIVRLFKVLFSRRRQYVINEIKESVKNNNSNIIEDLGLSTYNK